MGTSMGTSRAMGRGVLGDEHGDEAYMGTSMGTSRAGPVCAHVWTLLCFGHMEPFKFP